MSWISDVKFELTKLEITKKNLRNFGLLIGIIILVIDLYLYSSDLISIVSLSLISFSSLLILLGIIKPILLRKLFTFWMGLAFALGWIVSRILLTLLFIIILTPISIIAKIINKQFLDISYGKIEGSYWKKRSDREIKYDKMY
jgi:hypothetical protein